MAVSGLRAACPSHYIDTSMNSSNVLPYHITGMQITYEYYIHTRTLAFHYFNVLYNYMGSVIGKPLFSIIYVIVYLLYIYLYYTMIASSSSECNGDKLRED